MGSFAAWKAGNVVLGGFTLFLTFCIGIRFLVKPSTECENSAAKGEKLDWKGVAVATAASLFSARFANRVDNRMVGLVTDVILTAMGALLIVLHYWECMYECHRYFAESLSQIATCAAIRSIRQSIGEDRLTSR